MSSEAQRGDKGNSSIEVLNLSFPRCGTVSMQAALDILGYNCWHSMKCFGDLPQCQRWIAAQDAKFLNKGKPLTRSDWDAIFHSYTAISADPPATGFREDFIAAYPEAKVILVERNEDSWFKSFDQTVIASMFRWDMNIVSDLDPYSVGPIRDMQKHWQRSWWKCNTKAEMSMKARNMYREHNRIVRELVPADRLLLFKLQDGWGPLCAFLGKEVPDVPFPLRNDRKQLDHHFNLIRLRGLQMLGYHVLKFVGPVFVCGLIAWALNKNHLLGPNVWSRNWNELRM